MLHFGGQFLAKVPPCLEMPKRLCSHPCSEELLVGRDSQYSHLVFLHGDSELQFPNQSNMQDQAEVNS